MKTTMKFAAVAAAAVAMLLGATASFAQSKYDIKTAKKAAKELQKQGWHTEGGAKTIESYLVSYYMLEKEYTLTEGRSTISGNNTKVARRNAKLDAIQTYIELSSMEMKGAVAGLEGSLGENVLDNVTTNAVGKFQGKVEGELEVYFSLYKNEKDGKLSCINYCYIDKKKADQLKKESFIEAVEEVKGSKEFGKEVLNTINELQF